MLIRGCYLVNNKKSKLVKLVIKQYIEKIAKFLKSSEGAFMKMSLRNPVLIFDSLHSV